MTSEQGNSPQAPISQPKVYEAPQAGDILKNLQHGESPLDFIKRNLANPTGNGVMMPDPTPTPEAPRGPNPLLQQQAPTAPIEQKPAETSAAPVVSKEETPIFDFEKKDEPAAVAKAEEAKDATATAEGSKLSSEEEPLSDDVSAGAQHFKKLRLKVKETESTLKAALAEKEELKQQVEKYTKGEVIPEVLQQKEARIAELEHYEQLHNLKGSAAYKEKVAKPLEIKQTRLNAIAEDYGVPATVMTDALNFEKESELNGFLSAHFDGVGALEVKKIITDMKDLQAQAVEMERTPAQTFAQMQAEQAKINDAQEQERVAKLGSSSRNGWINALTKIRKEGRALELIRKEGDNAHNEKYVDPILKQASGEYGKFITALAKAGLKELPEEVGNALAEAVLLAHASAVALPTRNEAMRQAEELQKNTRYNNLIRPSVGGGVVTGGAPAAPRAALTPQEVAANQMQSILAKRGR